MKRKPGGKVIHGMSDTPIYRLWLAMLNRCYRKNVVAYPRYGGRGIKVCRRWHSFEGFFKDMCPRPEGMTLERVDNNKGYSPENCKWVSRRAQAQNTRRNVNVTIGGVTHCLSEWARINGIKQRTVSSRVNTGWSLEDSVTVPIHSRRSDRVEFTHNGETLTIGEWCKRLGFRSSCGIRQRIRLGWTIKEALSQPCVRR